MTTHERSVLVMPAMTRWERAYSTSLEDAPPPSMSYSGEWSFMQGSNARKYPKLTIHDLPDVDYSEEEIQELQAYLAKLKFEKRKNHARMTPEEEAQWNEENASAAEKQSQDEPQTADAKGKQKEAASADWVNTMFGQFIKREKESEVNEEYIVFDDGKSIDGVYSGFDNYMRTVREEEQQMANDVNTPWFYGTEYFRAMSSLEKQSEEAHQSKLPWHMEQMPPVIAARKMGITFETLVNKYKSEMLQHYLDNVERKKYMDPDRSHLHTVMLKTLCDEHDASSQQKGGDHTVKDNKDIEKQVQDARLALEILDAEEELLIATVHRFLNKYDKEISKKEREEHSQLRGSPQGQFLFQIFSFGWNRDETPQMINADSPNHLRDAIVRDRNLSPMQRLYSESSLFEQFAVLLEKDPASVMYTGVGEFITYEELQQRAEKFLNDLAEQKSRAMQDMENKFQMYESTLRNHDWVKQQSTEYKETLEVMLGRAANLMRTTGCIITNKDIIERTYRVCKQSNVVDESTMLNLFKVCRDSARVYALEEKRGRALAFPDRAFYNADVSTPGKMLEPSGLRAKISHFRSSQGVKRGFSGRQ